MITKASDDTAFLAGLASTTDPLWQGLFAFDITRNDITYNDGGFGRWYAPAYDLGIVLPYPWQDWIEDAGARFVRLLIRTAIRWVEYEQHQEEYGRVVTTSARTFRMPQET